MGSQASSGKNKPSFLRESWRRFLDLVSFNTPLARVVDFSSILLFLAIAPRSLIEGSSIKCVFKAYLLPLVFGGACPTTGLFADCDCPGCGMTRALWQILHGDFAGAYSLNAGAFIVFGLILILLIADTASLLRVRLNRRGA